MNIERDVEQALHDAELGDLRLPSVEVIERLASGELRTVDRRSTGGSRATKGVLLVAMVLTLVVATGLVVLRGRSPQSVVATSAGGAPSGPAFGVISSSGRAPLDAGENDASARSSVPVRIYHDGSTGGSLAIFGPGQTGTSSVDVLSVRYEPLAVGDLVAEVAYPSPSSNGLLLVRWGSSTASYALASRGVAVEVAAALAESLMANAGAAPPLAFELAYRGPDLNPFTGGTGLDRSMRYDDGTFYSFLPGVETLEDYVWFLEDVRRDRVGDRPVVIRGVGGREVAYWQEVGGVAIAASDGGSLADAVRDARPADESVWTAEKGRATTPGTIDQSVTATTQ